MKTWSNWPTSAVVLCFAAAMVRCSADGGAGGASFDERSADNGNGDPYAPDSGASVTGTGGSAPSLPPEVESESSFRVPVATDHYVWTANPLSGMVALIDARDRSVRTAPAGFGPTYLAAVPTPEGSDESRAIVINVLSQDAHLLIARADGEIDSYRINGIHSGANSWAVSPGGRWAVAWTNVADVTDPDPIEGFQDISVIDLDAVGEDTVEATRLSVAFRPTRLFISDDETRAFAVTEPGITVIDLGGSSPRVTEDLPVVSDGAIDDPAARDVTVTPDGQFALVRREGSSDVGIVSMDTGDIVTVPLSAPVTDLDLSGDGSIAVAVVRSRAVPVPVGAGGTTGASGAAGAPTAGSAGQMVGAAGELGVSGAAGAPGSGGVLAAGGTLAVGGGAGTPANGGSAGVVPMGGEGGVAPGGAAGVPAVAGSPGLAGAAGSAAGAPGLAGAAGQPGGAPGVAGAAGWPGGASAWAGAAGWLTAAGAAGSAGSAGDGGSPALGAGGLVAVGGALGAGGLGSGGGTPAAGGASSGGSGVGGGSGGLLSGGTGGVVVGVGGGSGGFEVGVGGGSGGTPPTVTYEWSPSEVAILRIPEIFTNPEACAPGPVPDDDACTVVTISDEASGDEIVGSVSLSEQGSQALLFTTVDPPAELPQANQHLTVLDISGGDHHLTFRTEHLRAAVHAVFVSPDDRHAIALLTPGPTSTMAGAFSIVPVIADLPPRIQGTTAPPVGVALAAAPANLGLVTVSDPVSEIYKTYLVQLPGLQVDTFELARRPLATGIVPSVAAGYVAQEHPDGRITFVTFDDSDHPIDYTLTGFELGATTGR